MFRLDTAATLLSQFNAAMTGRRPRRIPLAIPVRSR